MQCNVTDYFYSKITQRKIGHSKGTQRALGTRALQEHSRHLDSQVLEPSGTQRALWHSGTLFSRLAKRWLWQCSDHFFVSNFFQKYINRHYFNFFELPSLKMFFLFSYFFTNFILVILIKFPFQYKKSVGYIICYSSYWD